MKQIIKYSGWLAIGLGIALVVGLVSCKKDTLALYDTKPDIYFGLPVFSADNVTDTFNTTIQFSHTEYTWIRVSIGIRIMGDTVNYDRPVKVKATAVPWKDSDGNVNMAQEGVHWDSVYAYIPAGRDYGNVYVRALRVADEVGAREVAVQLTLEPNEHFETKFKRHMYDETNGYFRTTLTERVLISSVISAPYWWRPGDDAYANGQLGKYSKEKYRLLREEITGYPAAYFERVAIGINEDGSIIYWTEDGKTFNPMEQLPGFATQLRYYLYNEAIVNERKIPLSCNDVPDLEDLFGANWPYIVWDSIK
jgi:hypothetical protein